MENSPVYFIGGTFGSAGSGSSVWIILLTALMTAGGAFSVGWGLEQRKRALDRKALAASILAEVESVYRLLLHSRMEELYRTVQADLKEKLKAPDPEPGPVTPNDILNFPVTVYEKCADRIGTLGADVAADVWNRSGASAGSSSPREAR